MEVYPRSGPAVGGSSVTVHGEGFYAHAQDAELLRCRIGATWVAATLLNFTAVRCTSPAGVAAGSEAAAPLELRDLEYNVTYVDTVEPFFGVAPRAAAL